MNNFSIAIHGGAEILVKGMMTQELEIQYKQALKTALDKGYQVLEQGKTAVEAVEQAVIALEDSHLFNAGPAPRDGSRRCGAPGSRFLRRPSGSGSRRR